MGTIRLPSSAAMRALDVAAKYLSFTKAARELNITQSAVSHQIHHIEELWDVKIFQRTGRRLILTEAGEKIVPVIRRFIEQMELTINELQQQTERDSLRVSLLQSFAFKWLVPRLGEFHRVHPDIHVWLSTTDDLVDFTTSEVDVGIRLGHGRWPDVYCRLLLQEYVFPVASPRLLEQWPEPQRPEQLLDYPLIYRHSFDICPRWRDWFQDAGVKVKSLPRGSRFPDTSMAVQAAIDELGIALARSAHVEDDLQTGRLVKLLDVYSPSTVAYYVVCRKGREKEAAISPFIEWILKEARHSQRAFDRVAGVKPARSAVDG